MILPHILEYSFFKNFFVNSNLIKASPEEKSYPLLRP